MDVGERIGHYRILGHLGSGGMGQVYRAEDTRLKRQVALKILPEELAGDAERRRRFEREAEVIAGLDHPNIVTLYAIEEDGGNHFLTMQLVSGKPMSESIPGNGMDLERFYDVALQLVSAVDAAHRQGVTHRDLKPANVMISDEERVIVLDFGLAKLHRGLTMGGDPATRLTGIGQVMGTVAYMSPEQAQGLEVDERSDIFSLGSVMCEMLLGEPPFRGETRAAMMSSILKDDAPDLADRRPDLPPHLTRILRRCLQKDPERRYQTARDIGNDLEELRRDPETERPAGWSEVAGQPAAAGATPASPRWRRIAGAVVVAAALALAGAGLWRRAFVAPVTTSTVSTVSSIVALPPTVLGGAELEAVAETIPGVLSRALNRIDGLHVGLPPTRAELAAAGGDATLLPAVRAADAFLTSSLTAAGAGSIALNVQLVETAGQRILWSDDYAGPVGEATELARRAAEGARRALTGVGSATSVAGLEVSTEAEARLHQGQFYSSRYDTLRQPSDFRVALDSLETALRAEPLLAEAAVEAALLHLLAAEGGVADAVAAAEGWIERAETIESGSAALWTTRSLAEGLRRDGEPRRQLEWALRAASLRPRDARAQHALGVALQDAGYSTVLAMAAWRYSADLDALYHQPRLRLAGALQQHGRRSEARLLLDAIDQVEPGAPGVLAGRVAADLFAGDDAGAAAAIATLRTLAARRDLPVRWLESLSPALAAVAADPAPEALDPLRQLATAATAPRWRRVSVLHAALLLAARDNDDGASQLLAAAAEQDVLLPYDTYVLSPAFTRLRNEAAFESRLNESRQRARSMVEILEQADGRGELPEYLRSELEALESRLGSLH